MLCDTVSPANLPGARAPISTTKGTLGVVQRYVPNVFVAVCSGVMLGDRAEVVSRTW